jgi:prepilin-type N-terminal cleavage/methylation domain-containing protein
MNKKRRNIHQRGMTLLEIMIVLAIIALIMVFLIGPRVLKSLSKSESRSGCIESKQLAYDAYTEWRADTRKSCPGGLAELLEYSNKKDIKDPWGNDYQMMCKDKMPAGSKHPFGVYTYGPDGAEGGGDDIKSWECE